MSASNPKITVLLCTYNRSQYIGEAIESMIKQDFTNWELLVINDGGEDVGSIVSGFNDARIKYFNRKTNRGKSNCCNFGLEKARGKYIAYLDDDDHFYPNHLEVLSKALDENPDIGLAYSDLYALHIVIDHDTGKRYSVAKRIEVSRDFNRYFMLYYNHTLHVSIMHTKELATRVGGYDDDIKVLIDWNFTRKAVFFTDFKHVPTVTGEYAIQLSNSDRISFRERQDKESFDHNLRKIKANLPPEPWKYIRYVSIILPVGVWTDETKKFILELASGLSHPYKLILVNTNAEINEEEIREKLGKANDLRNLVLLMPEQKMSPAEAYIYGSTQVECDYCYLITQELKTDYAARLLILLDYITANPKVKAIKLDRKEEQKEPFNIFLPQSAMEEFRNDPLGLILLKPVIIPTAPPKGMVFDFLHQMTDKEFKAGNYEKALLLLESIQKIQTGVPGVQYLNQVLHKIALKVGRYEEAEAMCRSLIKRGYEADNWIRLGHILQAQERYKEAIEAFLIGLNQTGFREADLESPVYPLTYKGEFESHTAMIGLGECYLEANDLNRASKTFGRAFKLKMNSHLPFLGFARIFMANNEMEKAQAAIAKAGQIRPGDPKVNMTTGMLCEKQGRLDLAFNCYLRALEIDPFSRKNLNQCSRLGFSLGKWEEIKPCNEKFYENNKENLDVITRLAIISYNLSDYSESSDYAEQGLKLDPACDELLNLSFTLRHDHQLTEENAAVTV